MKKKLLLFNLFAGFAALVLMSYATGPASSPNNQGNRTGSPGSNGTCAGSNCHAATSSATTGSIVVKMKGSNDAENKYLPGKTYVITLTGNHVSLNKFGFQLVALNSSNQAIGTFANPSAGSKISTGSIVEHGTPLSRSSGGTGPFEATVEWTAPAANSGPVTFYGIINAVSGDGTRGGDAPSNTISKALTDGTNVNNVDNKMSVTTYPNPAKNSLVVKIDNASSGSYTINAFDVTGKKMMEETFNNNDLMLVKTINTEKWASGMYHVQIIKDGMRHITPVMKN